MENVFDALYFNNKFYFILYYNYEFSLHLEVIFKLKLCPITELGTCGVAADQSGEIFVFHCLVVFYCSRLLAQMENSLAKIKS